jgi:hypothetical protein
MSSIERNPRTDLASDATDDVLATSSLRGAACEKLKSDVSRVCPKCNGAMEQGFTVDLGMSDITTFGSRYVSRWAPGAPLKSLLFKTKVPTTVPIGTFRCASCGYLESYARPEFASRGRKQFSLRGLFILVTAVAVMLGLIGWLFF